MKPDARPPGANLPSALRSVAAQGRRSRHATELAAKVAFLSRAQSYPAGTRDVARIETHMSWVFLTEAHAFKLKKPVRSAFVDLRGLAARAHNCTEEVRLNRRLSSNVYLGVIPLVKDTAGNLALAASGDVVDWIVAMRRLPADRMLDHLVGAGTVSRRDIDALAAVRVLSPIPTRRNGARGVPAGFRGQHRGMPPWLCRPAYNLSAGLGSTCAQGSSPSCRGPTCSMRACDGRIVEATATCDPSTSALKLRPRSSIAWNSRRLRRRRRRRNWISRLGMRAPGRAGHRQADPRCSARQER